MIISRTPFRISFFGGGTDYPHWYNYNKGAVISATINKYCYLNVRFLPPFFKYKYCIRYYLREERLKLDDIKHPSVRESIKYLKINNGIEVVHNADLPAQSGLGSSSSFTVGIINALSALKGRMLTKKELTNHAIYVEQKIIKENVGSQDQSAAAFGGFNRINFGGSAEVIVNPIIINKKFEKSLQENLLLIFSGLSRDAEKVAKDQIINIDKNKDKYEKIYQLVNEAEDILIKQKTPDTFGELLNYQWQLKKTLSHNITNHTVDEMYNLALKNGAIGGKLLGAGNGGFMIFYAKKKNHNKILNKLKNFLHVPFRFDYTGSQIIYFSHGTKIK
jgi:D-glycero-alpha-D-manno-heptose-7-phosphate kinase